MKQLSLGNLPLMCICRIGVNPLSCTQEGEPRLLKLPMTDFGALPSCFLSFYRKAGSHPLLPPSREEEILYEVSEMVRRNESNTSRLKCSNRDSKWDSEFLFMHSHCFQPIIWIDITLRIHTSSQAVLTFERLQGLEGHIRLWRSSATARSRKEPSKAPVGLQVGLQVFHGE